MTGRSPEGCLEIHTDNVSREMGCWVFCFVFLSSPEDMFIDLRERRGRVGREKHWLPPVPAPTGGQTRNLLPYRATLQPTEPLGRAPVDFD